MAIAHGEFALASQMNPMGPVFFVLCLLQVPYRILRYLGYGLSVDEGSRLSRSTDLIIWILLFALVFSWAARLILEIMI